jgi:hypothetical protein
MEKVLSSLKSFGKSFQSLAAGNLNDNCPILILKMLLVSPVMLFIIWQAGPVKMEQSDWFSEWSES